MDPHASKLEAPKAVCCQWAFSLAILPPKMGYSFVMLPPSMGYYLAMHIYRCMWVPVKEVWVERQILLLFVLIGSLQLWRLGLSRPRFEPRPPVSRKSYHCLTSHLEQSVTVHMSHRTIVLLGPNIWTLTNLDTQLHRHMYMYSDLMCVIVQIVKISLRMYFTAVVAHWVRAFAPQAGLGVWFPAATDLSRNNR